MIWQVLSFLPLGLARSRGGVDSATRMAMNQGS